jgi:L-2-hydroxyglutarate oxidase LhgO
MTSETVDAVVIGAGVVGLAVARALAQAGREVIVLERNAGIGEEISARSSEVIHAGIYYPEGSRKATLCVRGRTLLYRYCSANGVPYSRCGKLIVATTPFQSDALEALRRRAQANGVEDLQLLSSAEIEHQEPALACVAGLLSPSTGIIDSHSFMLALRADLEAAGGSVALHSEFCGARVAAEGLRLTIRAGDEEMTLSARTVVNSAGLEASSVARGFTDVDAAQVPDTRLAKGNYFTLQGKSPFSRLIYPLPEPGGLGVHLTLDLAGRARFGPDVEWIDAVDYHVNPDRATAFYSAIRTYWPEIPQDSLIPGYAGIRPKIVGPDDPAADFVISGPEQHGVSGLINLFGIESPGLTAALAIGEEVAGLSSA